MDILCLAENDDKHSLSSIGEAILIQLIQIPSKIPMINAENQIRAPIWYSLRPSFFLIQK